MLLCQTIKGQYPRHDDGHRAHKALFPYHQKIRTTRLEDAHATRPTMNDRWSVACAPERFDSPIAHVKTSGGLLKDMPIHDFDMARWLLGEEPTEVFAWGSCLVNADIGEAGEIDTARTLLKTAPGKLCVIANSRRSGFGYEQRIEAYGSQGIARAANVLESTVQIWS